MSTIGTLIDYHYSLTLQCCEQVCKHQETVDLAALAAKIGRDHSCLAHDIEEYFVCSACGSKKLNFLLTSEAAERTMPAH